MYERQFHDWLISQGIDSYSNYVSRIRTIEKSLDINMDSEYEKDRCSGLLAQFKQNTNEPPIPINPKKKDKSLSYREGTADYASRIRKYKEFRDDPHYAYLKRLEEPVTDSTSNGNSVDTPIPSSPHHSNNQYQKSSRNKRKKNLANRNHIANAQNQFIRNLLSSLGQDSIAEEDWNNTVEFFDRRCAYCRTLSDEIDGDHAIPINRKKLGEHKLGNLVPACKQCNRDKGRQDYIEFCRKHNYIDAEQNIKEYMASCGYVPLTDDEEKANRIRKILDEAHKEIRDTAERYIDLIKELFFINE